MDQRQVARVVNGSQELQVWMKRGEAVAQSDRFGVTEGRVGCGRIEGKIAGTADCVIRSRIWRNGQVRATGSVSGVLDGDHGVQGVICAAQEDEQDLLDLSVRSGGRANAAFGQGP